jgi:hypothetical protein
LIGHSPTWIAELVVSNANPQLPPQRLSAMRALVLYLLIPFAFVDADAATSVVALMDRMQQRRTSLKPNRPVRASNQGQRATTPR